MIHNFNSHHINLLDVTAIVADSIDNSFVVVIYMTGCLKPTFEFEIDREDDIAMRKAEDLITAFYEAMETELEDE